MAGEAVPAMKGQLGNTPYYILSMKAGDLVNRVKIPKDMPDWKGMSIEERYQRNIDFNRVRKQIAPYLANDDSRFFGALIVTALNLDEKAFEEAFEPLSDITLKGLPGNLYREAAANMGFLTLRGGEMLVPLDGQHRLKAIAFALTATDNRDKPISGISPCTQLAQEDVTVILVPYEQQKARKIFTRVNKYARRTTTGQDIVTDDDDIIAVLTRDIANDLIGGRLAKYTSNTLRAKDPEFTTLAIIYNCNKEIIATAFPNGKVDTTQPPDPRQAELYRDEVQRVWEVLLEGVKVFADALSDKEETGDKNRCEIRKTNLLGKPVGQECLVRAFLRLTDAPTNMGDEKACEQLNALPWSITEKNLQVWQNVLWTGGVDGKILTKNRNRTLATKIIAYLAGENITNEKKAELLKEYRGQFPEAERRSKKLPEPPQ